jgi:hypothetical protein
MDLIDDALIDSMITLCTRVHLRIQAQNQGETNLANSTGLDGVVVAHVPGD